MAGHTSSTAEPARKAAPGSINVKRGAERSEPIGRAPHVSIEKAADAWPIEVLVTKL